MDKTIQLEHAHQPHKKYTFEQPIIGYFNCYG